MQFNDRDHQVIPEVPEGENLLDLFHDFTVILTFTWVGLIRAPKQRSKGEPPYAVDWHWDSLCVRVKAVDSFAAGPVALDMVKREMAKELAEDPPDSVDVIAVFAGWHENELNPLEESPEEDDPPITK